MNTQHTTPAPSDPAVALRENQCRCGKGDRNDFDLEVLGHTCYCPGCAATTPWFPTQVLARASWAAMQRPDRVVTDAQVEEAAQAIFQHYAFYGDDLEKPAWCPGGNSTRQDQARCFARAALKAAAGDTP